MTDLQKQIEELEFAANQEPCHDEAEPTRSFIRLEKHMARKALSIIKQLQNRLEIAETGLRFFADQDNYWRAENDFEALALHAKRILKQAKSKGDKSDK